MPLFCPLCGNLMFIQVNTDDTLHYVCRICPVNFSLAKVFRYRNFHNLKQIDDVLGGEEAWKNVDSTAITCPKCSNDRAYFLQIQTRSADEPMTTFYKCTNSECSYNWRD